MKELQPTGGKGFGKMILLDDEDFEKYGHLRWYLSGGKYAARKSGRRIVYLHRIIMDAPEGMVVDHRNHNTLDCRKQNLRICTQEENCRNTPKCRGYYFDKWAKRFNVQYRGKYFGRYQTEKEAQRAYRLASSGLTLAQVKEKVQREFA